MASTFSGGNYGTDASFGQANNNVASNNVLDMNRIKNDAGYRDEYGRLITAEQARLTGGKTAAPGQLLANQASSNAYGYRNNLQTTQSSAASDLKANANATLDEGVRHTREGANSRGLLYSGMREGAEQGMRGRVANALASQIAGSNADLSKVADAKDAAAAKGQMGNAQLQQEAEMAAEKQNTENSVMRAQQMQQLAGSAGYLMGNMTSRPSSASARPSGLVSDDAYLGAYRSDPYEQYMRGGR